MQHFSPPNLDTAFIRTGTPMFSDVITMLHADAALSKVRRRDLISAVSRGAKILQRAPETILNRSGFVGDHQLK